MPCAAWMAAAWPPLLGSVPLIDRPAGVHILLCPPHGTTAAAIGRTMMGWLMSRWNWFQLRKPCKRRAWRPRDQGSPCGRRAAVFCRVSSRRASPSPAAASRLSHYSMQQQPLLLRQVQLLASCGLLCFVDGGVVVSVMMPRDGEAVQGLLT